MSVLSLAAIPASIIPGTWLAGCGQRSAVTPSQISCPFLPPGTYRKKENAFFRVRILTELIKSKENK